MGDGEEVKDAVRRAAGGGDGGDGVLDRCAGDDLSRPEAPFHEVDGELAHGDGHVLLGRVRRRDRTGTHLRQAEHLHGGGHGVGRELTTTGTGAGAGGILDGLELVGADLALRVGTDGLEDVLDRQIATVVPSRHDGAAVEHDGGDVETTQGEDGTGRRLVTPSHGDDSVEHVAAGDQLDGVGDDLAADEGGLHAFRAHGDAVGYGDRVVLQRRATGLANASFHIFGQAAQVEVAGADLRPRVGDADHRLAEVVVGVASGFVHGARRGARGAIDDGAARSVHRDAFFCSTRKQSY